MQVLIRGRVLRHTTTTVGRRHSHRRAAGGIFEGESGDDGRTPLLWRGEEG